MADRTMALQDLYAGADPREVPMYTMADAARYLRIPSPTVRSWVRGRRYPLQDGEGFFDPLVTVPGSETRLAFLSLIELHIIRALRKDHRVPLRHVRTALTYAEEQLGIERLLLQEDLRTAAGELFLDQYGRLLDLSKSGQLAMKMMLREHLERVEWGLDKIPVRLYPFPFSHNGGTRTVVIDPLIAFGRPTVVGKGISTAAIVRRVDAGERVRDLALDYAIPQSLVEAAILYEQAA